MSNQPGLTLRGFLVLDKPLRLTSMDAIAIVRRKAGGAKTGHAGTLDPLATGVLLVALGPATKLIDRFMATTKKYTTVIDLSAFTSTDDLEGQRTEVPVDAAPDRNLIQQALSQFTGAIMQRPPAFSAMKIGGTRAYKLARQGASVDIPPRPAVVHSMDLLRYEWPQVELAIHCDKGFYVRSLARDLGRALGVGGHCLAIRRTAVGPFTIDQAIPIDRLPASISQTDLISVDEALARLSY